MLGIVRPANLSGYPTPQTSFEDLYDYYNDDLLYVGDFEKDGPGYQYIKRQYEKDPAKYLREAEASSEDYDEKNYVTRINIKASDIETKYEKAAQGDEDAAKWVKRYEKRVAKETSPSRFQSENSSFKRADGQNTTRIAAKGQGGEH